MPSVNLVGGVESSVIHDAWITQFCNPLLTGGNVVARLGLNVKTLNAQNVSDHGCYQAHAWQLEGKCTTKKAEVL